MADTVVLDNLAVVLHQPRYPENIGSAARALCNMGMSRLHVVAPENYDLERVRRLATHAAAKVVDRIALFDNLPDALAPFRYVVGTSARIGAQRQATFTPRRLGRHLVSVSAQNQVALVFGPEDRGLSNEDLRRCHILVNIPSARFSSLNLAQAVMVVCYEIFTAGRSTKGPYVPRMAQRHELDGMYEQVKEVLVNICYINPENPDYWMNKMRHFFTRLQLQAREVSIIRGICRQVNWYGRKCFEDGRRAESSRGKGGPS
jgi:tRNA/rRNA methyltransferase